MKLNPLLVVAAALYGAAGLALTFAPDELLSALRASATPMVIWLAQLLGAALLGLACLNYLLRHATVRGILGRPLLLVNLTFLAVSFFATLGSWRDTSAPLLLAMAAVVGALLVAFAVRLFSRPASAPERQ